MNQEVQKSIKESEQFILDCALELQENNKAKKESEENEKAAQKEMLGYWRQVKRQIEGFANIIDFSQLRTVRENNYYDNYCESFLRIRGKRLWGLTLVNKKLHIINTDFYSLFDFRDGSKYDVRDPRQLNAKKLTSSELGFIIQKCIPDLLAEMINKAKEKQRKGVNIRAERIIRLIKKVDQETIVGGNPAYSAEYNELKKSLSSLRGNQSEGAAVLRDEIHRLAKQLNFLPDIKSISAEGLPVVESTALVQEQVESVRVRINSVLQILEAVNPQAYYEYRKQTEQLNKDYE